MVELNEISLFSRRIDGRTQKTIPVLENSIMALTKLLRVLQKHRGLHSRNGSLSYRRVYECTKETDSLCSTRVEICTQGTASLST
jgi:hypothetical protein